MYGGGSAIGGGKVFSLYCSSKEADKKLIEVTTFNIDKNTGLIFSKKNGTANPSTE